VLAAIRTLNRLECVGETLRAALNELASIAPEWLREHAAPEWFDRYSTRIEDSRLPKGKEARKEYAEVIGADGSRLLISLYDLSTPLHLRELPAVQILRRIWIFHYYAEEGRLRWRKAEDLPPAGMRFDSPYDPEARFGNKRSVTWTGYKVHLTETCEDEEIHLITHVETTAAGITDSELSAPIHDALAKKDLLPREHFLDSGYVDADLVVKSQRDLGIEVIGPMRPDSSWQGVARTRATITRILRLIGKLTRWFVPKESAIRAGLRIPMPGALQSSASNFLEPIAASAPFVRCVPRRRGLPDV